MLHLADTFEIDVSVVRTGYPLLVFPTNRPSDLPQGRAFDSYRIDGQLVVDPATPRSLVAGFMRAAASAGSYNVGGRYLLGCAPQYFSDQTHHDHVHASFSSRARRSVFRTSREAPFQLPCLSSWCEPAVSDVQLGAAVLWLTRSRDLCADRARAGGAGAGPHGRRDRVAVPTLRRLRPRCAARFWAGG